MDTNNASCSSFDDVNINVDIATGILYGNSNNAHLRGYFIILAPNHAFAQKGTLKCHAVVRVPASPVKVSTRYERGSGGMFACSQFE